ncbi:MAG: phosphatidylglycerophosphatase A [Ignavibacteria bacterium]|nr:phosphatidylglycerophosphatase A [Ignavibacteria bacterium]
MSNSFARMLATLFGIGKLPIMPGTWCSAIVAVPALFTTNSVVAQYVYVAASVIFLLLGLWSIPKVQPQLGTDPKSVVIDEAAGMALILATPYAYFGPGWWASSVLIFRVYDVVKPYPINKINDRTEGWSVVADDMLASVFTILTLAVLFPAFNIAMLAFL